MILLLACAPPGSDAEPLPPTYSVVGVRPEDGASDVVEATSPELRLSEPVDLPTCPDDGARVDAIDPSGAVLFRIEAVLAAAEDGDKLRIEPLDPLPRGSTYALTVRAGEGGCHSTSGATLAPFQSTFTVP